MIPTWTAGLRVAVCTGAERSPGASPRCPHSRATRRKTANKSAVFYASRVLMRRHAPHPTRGPSAECAMMPVIVPADAGHGLWTIGRMRGLRSTEAPLWDGPATTEAQDTAAAVMQPPRRSNVPNRWRLRCRSSRASSRARHRSRTASASGVGGRTSVSKPARNSSANFRASRRFVLIRSPGLHGMSDGAIT